jgi:hypothetical protein
MDQTARDAIPWVKLAKEKVMLRNQKARLGGWALADVKTW